MTTTCTVCNSVQRLDVETALAAGGSALGVAKKFGLGRMALTRHMKNCIPLAVAKVTAETTAAAIEKRETESGESLLGQMERLQAITWGLIDRAEQGVPVIKDGQVLVDADGRAVLAQDSDLTLRAIAAAKKNIELMARMTGQLEPPEQKGAQSITFQQFVVICREAGLELS